MQSIVLVPDIVETRADAQPLTAPDSLFQPHRIPWQLEIDHGAAASMKIQPFASGVSRQQNSRIAVDEVVQR